MVKTRSMDTDHNISIEIAQNISMESKNSKEAENCEESDESQNENCSSMEINEEVEIGDQALNYSILQQFYVEYLQLDNVKTRVKHLECEYEEFHWIFINVSWMLKIKLQDVEICHWMFKIKLLDFVNLVPEYLKKFP